VSAEGKRHASGSTPVWYRFGTTPVSCQCGAATQPHWCGVPAARPRGSGGHGCSRRPRLRTWPALDLKAEAQSAPWTLPAAHAWGPSAARALRTLPVLSFQEETIAGRGLHLSGQDSGVCSGGHRGRQWGADRRRGRSASRESGPGCRPAGQAGAAARCRLGSSRRPCRRNGPAMRSHRVPPRNHTTPVWLRCHPDRGLTSLACGGKVVPATALEGRRHGRVPVGWGHFLRFVPVVAPSRGRLRVVTWHHADTGVVLVWYHTGTTPAW
jgi:hypothetical protein